MPFGIKYVLGSIKPWSSRYFEEPLSREPNLWVWT